MAGQISFYDDLYTEHDINAMEAITYLLLVGALIYWIYYYNTNTNTNTGPTNGSRNVRGDTETLGMPLHFIEALKHDIQALRTKQQAAGSYSKENHSDGEDSEDDAAKRETLRIWWNEDSGCIGCGKCGERM